MKDPRRTIRCGLVIGLGLLAGCSMAPMATQAPEAASLGEIASDPAAAIGTYAVMQLGTRAQLRRQCRALCRRVRPDVGLRRCIRFCEIRFRACAGCMPQAPGLETDGSVSEGGVPTLLPGGVREPDGEGDD